VRDTLRQLLQEGCRRLQVLDPEVDAGGGEQPRPCDAFGGSIWISLPLLLNFLQHADCPRALRRLAGVTFVTPGTAIFSPSAFLALTRLMRAGVAFYQRDKSLVRVCE
jgi:hypothetical protein